jgi:hypothetical protein
VTRSTRLHLPRIGEDGSVSAADGHDSPGSIDELVPSLAAVVDDVVIGCEDAVRQPVAGGEGASNVTGEVCEPIIVIPMTKEDCDKIEGTTFEPEKS